MYFWCGATDLCKNYEDIVDVLSNPDSGIELLASAIHIARIKVELGLLRGPLDLRPDMDLEILFLMAGFNMKSRAIEREVRHMHPSIPARIIFQDAGDAVIDYGRARGCGDLSARFVMCFLTRGILVQYGK